MAHNIDDIDLIIARLGYTPSQQDLTKHQILKLLKEIHQEKYQAVKTHVSIMNKTGLTLAVINLLLENQALAQIAIAGVNQLAAERVIELNQEQPKPETVTLEKLGS
jgi:hypothetical protein